MAYLRWAAVAAIAAALLAGPFAIATVPSALSSWVSASGMSGLCGTSIKSDLSLNQDMTCSGNGIGVGVDGVTISLNGHSLIGPGSGLPTIGIRVIGRASVSIVGPGAISGFTVGILVLNSTTIAASDVRVVGSSGGAIDGIRVVLSSGVRVEGVSVSGVRDDAIEVYASSNVWLDGNRLMDNGAGVAFTDTTSSGIMVTGNLIVRNGCGIQGPSRGHTFEGNQIRANGSVTCP